MTGVAAGGFLYALAGGTADGPGNYATAERYDPRAAPLAARCRRCARRAAASRRRG